MESIPKALKEYGLSDKETSVYLAVLQSGLVSVTRISELTALPKSTCYDVLRALIDKGLCSCVEKGKIRHFEANEPEALVDRLREKEALVGEIMPSSGR
jgi:sugar-specific transcriptional regulator TrmB